MTSDNMADPTGFRRQTGYMPIEQYGLIGNMRTSALVAIDGGIDFMCWPDFDSPSVFCRMLDKNKGGHFTISPSASMKTTTKQQYLPSNNILQTRYLHEDGVLNLLDFFPRPLKFEKLERTAGQSVSVDPRFSLKKWLVRKVECIRGDVDVNVEVFPAFNYAQDPHTTEIIDNKDISDGQVRQTVRFRSKNLSLELVATIDCGDDDLSCPSLSYNQKKINGCSLGEGVTACIKISEGQSVTFVLREIDDDSPENITTSMLSQVQSDTSSFWFNWISKSRYKGRWRETVHRSLMILKLLTFELTGAIVAAPTFSIPEAIGGVRQWDYRFSWVRDSSFVVYIFLRLGFSAEAEAYMSFINDRMIHSRTPDGGLPIMFSIRGDTDLPEIELNHLEGYQSSDPVRIGNGAAFHKQLDIYGELMDAVYLYNKYGKPVSYDTWVSVRTLTDYVCKIWNEEDMSIWEVRGRTQQFVYSKIMLWVAIDRALRLADKRCFPCPNRIYWLTTRDFICDDVMEKGYNKEMGCFIQSYEANDVLDSAVLIAPLVFFVAPNDPRFTSTLEMILKPPEKGGLTSTGLVYRYNTLKSDDGVGGKEGAFSMCTFWLVEALTRAGAYDRKYLVKAINIFENMLSFSNHLGMFSEEISSSGEQLGNTPQAFSHLALISAAFNLDRVTQGSWGM